MAQAQNASRKESKVDLVPTDFLKPKTAIKRPGRKVSLIDAENEPRKAGGTRFGDGADEQFASQALPAHVGHDADVSDLALLGRIVVALEDDTGGTALAVDEPPVSGIEASLGEMAFDDLVEGTSATEFRAIERVCIGGGQGGMEEVRVARIVGIETEGRPLPSLLAGEEEGMGEVDERGHETEAVGEEVQASGGEGGFCKRLDDARATGSEPGNGGFDKESGLGGIAGRGRPEKAPSAGNGSGQDRRAAGEDEQAVGIDGSSSHGIEDAETPSIALGAIEMGEQALQCGGAFSEQGGPGKHEGSVGKRQQARTVAGRRKVRGSGGKKATEDAANRESALANVPTDCHK